MRDGDEQQTMNDLQMKVQRLENELSDLKDILSKIGLVKGRRRGNTDPCQKQLIV